MKKTILVSAITTMALAPLGAQSWQILGTQALGMGGAFVAVAQGPHGQYWNPAGLALSNNFSGLSIPAGARGEFTGGILKDAHLLSNVAKDYANLQDAQKNGKALDAKEAAALVQGVSALGGLNKTDKGILVDVHAGLDLKISRFAISVNNFTSVGASPFVDTVNIGLGTISGVSGSGVFSSETPPAPVVQAANQASADKIESAVATIGYTQLEELFCGSAGCLATKTNNVVTNADSFANVLVDQAETAGATSAQITEAAQKIADNAAAAAPLIGAATSGNPYTNNTSNLTLRGATFFEVALGWGQKFFVPGLYLGANLKAIQGSIGYEKFAVLTKETDGGEVLSNFDNAVQKTTQFGIDVGAIYDLGETLPFIPFKPKVGMTARNVNGPSFDAPLTAIQNGEDAKYNLDSQVRVGAALKPFNFWTISADMDMTENKTSISGFKSRLFGVGTEINVFNKKWLNIPLRAGMMKNIAETNSKFAYTAGAGLNFLHFTVDLGLAISTELEKYTDESGADKQIPANAMGALQLGLIF